MGLSVQHNDSKWSDMLNFRSDGNTTQVVTPKVRIGSMDGLHTLVASSDGLVFALGRLGSLRAFLQNGAWSASPVWQLNSTFNGTRNDRAEAEQRLLIKGTYLGTEPKKVRVTYAGGKLVLAKDEDTPPVLPPVPTELGNEVSITGFVKNSATLVPIPGALLTWSFAGYARHVVFTNEEGYYEFLGLPRAYDVDITAPGYQAKETTHDSTTTRSFTDYLDPELVALFLGVEIIVRYSNTAGPVPGGHQCDAATYKVFGNDLLLGEANLNNLIDGGDREAIITITADQAQTMVETYEDHILRLSLECDPDNPEYDHDAGYGDTCHVELAWVIVRNSLGNELYNGAPVGNFAEISLIP